MFITNEFYHEYFSIINKARSCKRVKNKDVYFESHHIVPRCMNGTDDANNLVLLTYTEHCKCHELLPKFTSGDAKRKLLFAWSIMRTNQPDDTNKNEYQQLRSKLPGTRLGSTMSEESKHKLSKARMGKPSGMLGKSHSISTITKMKDSARKRAKQKCPYCDKTGSPNNMSRWHFKNCKFYDPQVR